MTKNVCKILSGVFEILLHVRRRFKFILLSLFTLQHCLRLFLRLFEFIISGWSVIVLIINLFFQFLFKMFRHDFQKVLFLHCLYLICNIVFLLKKSNLIKFCICLFDVVSGWHVNEFAFLNRVKNTY